MRKILNSRAICRVRSRVADVVSFLEKVHVASRENTRDRTRGIVQDFPQQRWSERESFSKWRPFLENPRRSTEQRLFELSARYDIAHIIQVTHTSRAYLRLDLKSTRLRTFLIRICIAILWLIDKNCTLWYNRVRKESTYRFFLRFFLLRVINVINVMMYKFWRLFVWSFRLSTFSI